MEFLVRIEIGWPPDRPEEERERVFAQELEAGQRLAHAGALRRLWRIPGRWANWSLYDVEDATALHEALTSLPLFPWMDIEVHPLAEHQNDPRRLGIDPPVPEGVMTMKLLALTPIDVSPREVARRQARYDAIAPDGMQVVVRCPPGLPSELGSEEDIAKSDAVLVSTYAAEDGAWDGFLPDCVLDPAVHAAASLPVPIHGIGRLAMHALAGAGLSWRAVARNEPIAHELDRLAGHYELTTSGQTVVLSLSVADIADQAGWAAALTSAVSDLPCDAVLNGCSAVDVPIPSRGPAVVDPTALALRALAGIVAP